MDKAAEKMVLVYIIGKFEERIGHEVDWDWLIYASLFDLLKKIALCDIKAPVQRMIKRDYPLEYEKLDRWVLAQYRSLIDDELFCAFSDYLSYTNFGDGEISSVPGSLPPPPVSPVRAHSERIRRAAHKYSTQRELDMISMVNEPERLRDIRREVAGDLEDYLDLQGLQELISKQRPYEFLLCVERLRFQIRWNQTPRVPKTSVLGHSFYVAILTVLLARDVAHKTGLAPCPKRRCNNFFSGLFHDLPEAVTRDIISPVKRAAEDINAMIKKVEDAISEKELSPLMEDFYRDELKYFTDNEFDTRITENGVVKIVTYDELNKSYNTDRYSPVDGALVRLADHIAAFIEADQSIRHGITSAHLQDGRDGLYATYKSAPPISAFPVAPFFQALAGKA
jgi:putative hydrolase of HD superfamily